MFIKALPGLAIALALAVFFNPPEGGPQAARRHTPGVRPVTTRRRSSLLPAVGTTYRSADKTEAAFHPGIFSESAPAADHTAEAVVAVRNSPVNPMPAGMTRPIAAQFPPPPVPLFRDANEQAVHKGKSAVTSHSALASMDAAAMEPPGLCDPEKPSPRFGGHYMELPAKGIYAWAGAEALRGKSGNSRANSNAFERKDANYSLGLKYDWSVDSVIGLSVSRLDSEVSSREAGDSRRNDIRGTLVEGRYDGYFLEKYPFSIGGFYGAMKTKGEGWFGHDAGRWMEAEHDSDYYGLKASFRVPLIFRDQYKMTAEVGVDYRALKSDPYSFTYEGGPLYRLPARTSESLLIPMDFTFRKDFPQSWGIVTPGIGFGVAYELKGSANGVRSWHASSAAVRYEGGQFLFSGDDLWKGAVATVRLGVEARTVGGWELRANYVYTAADNYKENRFNLELGKCF